MPTRSMEVAKVAAPVAPGGALVKYSAPAAPAASSGSSMIPGVSDSTLKWVGIGVVLWLIFK